MSAVLSDDYALMQKIENLRSAEDFLAFFDVEYDTNLITAKRVVFLRLFRQVMDDVLEPTWEDYKRSLAKAYCLLEKGVVVAHNMPACGGCDGC